MRVILAKTLSYLIFSSVLIFIYNGYILNYHTKLYQYKFEYINDTDNIKFKKICEKIEDECKGHKELIECDTLLLICKILINKYDKIMIYNNITKNNETYLIYKKNNDTIMENNIDYIEIYNFDPEVYNYFERKGYTIFNLNKLKCGNNINLVLSFILFIFSRIVICIILKQHKEHKE